MYYCPQWPWLLPPYGDIFVCDVRECVCVCAEIRGQLCRLVFFFPFIFLCIVGVELEPSDLHSKHLYLLSYQTSPVTSSRLFGKAATIFPRFPFPMWFWSEVKYKKNLYSTWEAGVKQQPLPHEGHLVDGTDQHTALSASPGSYPPASGPDAYVATRWRAPALSGVGSRGQR